jgi:RNA polymerase sigma-70 factor, ECF subfamily
VNAAGSNSDETVLAPAMAEAAPLQEAQDAGIAPRLAEELWRIAGAESCGLGQAEFESVLAGVGAKHNFGLPVGETGSEGRREAFFRGLHLKELALAHGCARGKDAAWERFVGEYRGMLTQAAMGITGSASLGEELADSLYAELYGLRQADGERRSPFASYSGRGSLQGWLRTTLVQRFRAHHRRTHRESALEDVERAAPEGSEPGAPDLRGLTASLGETLAGRPAEERFLLAAYFLDRRTLKEIAQMLGVHEATVSRKVQRLVGDVRKDLLKNLQRRGMSRRAAEEALGTDPRDLAIDLRAVLQSSQSRAFLEKTAVGEAASDKG